MDSMESRTYKNPYTRFLINKDKVIIANIKKGFWVKTTKEMYDFICDSIEKKRTIKEMIDEGEDDYTKKCISDFVKKLIRNSLLDLEERFQNKEKDQLDEVYINLTNRCNLRCLHCCVNAGEDIREELSSEDVYKVIDRCIELNPKKITLTGGEIFVREDIEAIIKYISNKFHGIIALMTNGILINDNRIKLIKEYVDEVHISLDGYDEETTNYIRGKNVFKKVMNVIQALKNEAVEKISLSMVETKLTKNHRKDFENLCDELGVKAVVRGFEPIGRGEENYNKLAPIDSEKDDTDEKNMLDTESKEKTSILTSKCLCGAGRTVLSLDCMGNIYACELLQNAEYKLGNILDGKKQLNSEFNWNVLDKCILDSIEECKDCNIRYFCSTSCPNSDLLIYNNESYRKSRCNMIKQKLNSLVWENA